ncbi:CPBP family intramembrane glutamic endopeptidase [Collinsella tanakaei]|uniref:CPBP family intramembrane glutamic endopeptidase n=1 Tax=Collinsella tanakaei TaxID=626935 RepID=UPI0025A43994|nr:CPBP family glutamic-type intramembrane protease [Collinsella tanakaei]MDM8300025.1 CPBP family glutamic-type intramembrane protease [Collinsella tanakaei]
MNDMNRRSYGSPYATDAGYASPSSGPEAAGASYQNPAGADVPAPGQPAVAPTCAPAPAAATSQAAYGQTPIYGQVPGAAPYAWAPGAQMPALPPRPSMQPQSPAKGRAGWLAAALGAFISVLAAQMLISFVGAIVLTIGYAIIDPTAGVDAVTNAIMGPLMLAAQLGCLAIFLPWWLHLRPVSFVESMRGRASTTAGMVALRIVAIVILGVGLQLAISYALTFLLPLAPDLQTEYTDLMNDGVTSEFSVLSVIILAIGAPVTEELACRGVIFEFALRMLCPSYAARWQDRSWRKATGTPMPSFPAVPSASFWMANLFQALLFGILHLNLVQGLYAFVLGAVLGWVAWRTGGLAYNIGLHLVVNFSSYFVAVLASALEIGGVVFAVMAAVSLVALGIWLFWFASRPAAAIGKSA